MNEVNKVIKENNPKLSRESRKLKKIIKETNIGKNKIKEKRKTLLTNKYNI